MKTNPNLNHWLSNEQSPRLVALGLLTLLLLAALARSHGQEAATMDPGPAGVYALTSVDGKAVPCTIRHEGAPMDVRSGAFTITTNGQCVSVMTVSVGNRKDVRVERRASYVLSGGELKMKWEGAGRTQGRVTGDTFTMTNEGLAYVYRR